MAESIRDTRLKTELEAMNRLMEDSSLVYFEARGVDREYPEEYMVRFDCRGLHSNPGLPQYLFSDWKRTSPALGDSHIVYIYLPATYPRTPPRVQFKTPVFHPNIKQFPTTPEQVESLYKPLVEQIGGLDNLMMMMQADPALADKIFSAYVCIDVLWMPEDGGNYSPKVTLYDLCVEIGKMIMYQRYSLEHGLNEEARLWAREAQQIKGLLPIDNRRLLDKLPIQVRLMEVGEDEVPNMGQFPTPASAIEANLVEILGEEDL